MKRRIRLDENIYNVDPMPVDHGPVLGSKLDGGAHRDVYDVGSGLVVKVENGNDHVNVLEWKIWDFIKADPVLSPLFAMCSMLSTDGRLLVQEKIEFRTKPEYPSTASAVFTDFHIGNFGWTLDDRFVCCDYGSPLVFAKLYKYRGRTKRVKWRVP